MKRVGMVIGLVMLSGCGIEGLHNANPKLSMRLNPATGNFDLSSNRDDDAAVKGLEVVTSNGTRVKLDEAHFNGNASSVREANYFQMMGMTMQATANWNGAVNLIGAAGEALTKVLPYVPKIQAAAALAALPRNQSVATPWGQLSTGTGFTPEQIAALERLAGSALEPQAATTQPATGPKTSEVPARQLPTVPVIPAEPAPAVNGLDFGN